MKFVYLFLIIINYFKENGHQEDLMIEVHEEIRINLLEKNAKEVVLREIQREEKNEENVKEVVLEEMKNDLEILHHLRIKVEREEEIEKVVLAVLVVLGEKENEMKESVEGKEAIMTANLNLSANVQSIIRYQ